MPPVMGEILRPIQMPESIFLKEQSKLKGMNETRQKLTLPATSLDQETIRKKIYQVANVLFVPFTSEDEAGTSTLRFAGQTLASKVFLLISVKVMMELAEAELVINCEKIVVGNMLAKEIKKVVESS